MDINKAAVIVDMLVESGQGEADLINISALAFYSD
jgi:hypothetical protein